MRLSIRRVRTQLFSNWVDHEQLLMNNRFILSYSVAVFGTGILLGALNVQLLEVYYSLYLVEFLVLIELMASVKSSLTIRVQPLAIAFFLGFMYIVAQRILLILAT